MFTADVKEGKNSTLCSLFFFFLHRPGTERATDHINNIALCPLAGSSMEPSLSITRLSQWVATIVTVAKYDCVLAQ